MNKQIFLRGEIKLIEDQIALLHKQKFEKKKELLQEIHKFKINDFVVYEKVDGKIIYGRIDIINNTNNTKGGQAIIYTDNNTGDLPMNRKYTIIYLHDWTTERDPRLKILSSH